MANIDDEDITDNFKTPGIFKEKLQTLNNQLPAILADFKKYYVFFNKIDEHFLNEKIIEANIKNQKDIIGRDDIFTKQSIDNSYPKYILDNLVRLFIL